MPRFYPRLRPATPQADPGLTHTIPLSDLTDLENIKNNVTGNYYLTCDIDAILTADPGYEAGKGWKALCAGAPYFTGTIDGCGHKISNLFINRPTEIAGFFMGVQAEAVIANLSFDNVDMLCGSGGVLASYLMCGGSVAPKIYNCHVSGILKAGGTYVREIGGMFGSASLGWGGSGAKAQIYDSTSAVTIDAVTYHTDPDPNNVGGFFGHVNGMCIARNCLSTGNVTACGVTGTGGQAVGGFVGWACGSYGPTDEFYDCAAEGDVIGDSLVGGFVGFGAISDFYRCSAVGNVTAVATAGTAGGFDASLGNTAVEENCYAWGNVVGGGVTGKAGGFVTQSTGTNTHCYSIGTVAAASKGGFSVSGGTYDHCFWDKESSGQPTSGGGTGLTTIQAQTESTYTSVGWDFVTVWYMPKGARQKIMGRPKTGYPVHGPHTAMRNVFG